MNRMGNEIARLRKEVGLSQKEFAKMAGVSENFIMNIESGKKIVSSDFVAKINKVIRKKVGDLDIYEIEMADQKPEPDKNIVKVIEKPIQQIWDDALAGAIMDVPIYNYNLDKVLDIRKLPIISNKVECFSKEQAMFVEIEDNEMSGFRIIKGDIAFANKTSEIEEDGIFLIQYKSKRIIRQLKKLESDQLLIITNGSSFKTETSLRKSVKILARLIRLEIKL